MDTYTKGVMTVIAIALVSISFQLSGTASNKIAICNPEGTVCADVYESNYKGRKYLRIAPSQ